MLALALPACTTPSIDRANDRSSGPLFAITSDEPVPPLDGCIAQFATGEVKVNGATVPDAEVRSRLEIVIVRSPTNLGFYSEFPAKAEVFESQAINVLFGDGLDSFGRRTGRTVVMHPSQKPDCSDLTLKATRQ